MLRSNPANSSVPTHEELVRKHCGLEQDPSFWATRDVAKEKLLDQSLKLANRLESKEVQAFLPQTLTAISAVTSQVSLLHNFRPIRFLPFVAARDRSPTLQGLKFWIDSNWQAKKHLRYAVVTYGQPISVGDDLREAITDLTKRISRWGSDIRKEWDIELIYRGVEYTRKKRGDSDEYTYHLHCNVLFWPHKALKTKENPHGWEDFLEFTHDRLKAHWKDCGQINNVEEIIKYVIKPEDLEDTQDDELVWLYESTFKKRISTPMGSFKLFMRQLKKDGMKIAYKELEKELGKVKKARRLGHKKRDQEEKSSSCGEAKNIILGITLPQRKHTPWSEPAILVRNYDPNAMGKAADAFRMELKTIQMEATLFWQQNGAPDPQTALQVASAARAGAKNVAALKAQAKGRSPNSSIVHNTRVIAQNQLPGLEAANDAILKIDTLTDIGHPKRFRSSGNGPPSAS